MSQLFESLRRGRRAPGVPAAPSRTAQGEALLATLGYAAPRRKVSGAAVLLVTAGLVATGYVAWRLASGPSPPPSVSPQARAPEAPARAWAPGPPPASTPSLEQSRAAAPPDVRVPGSAALAGNPQPPVDAPPPQNGLAPTPPSGQQRRLQNGIRGISAAERSSEPHTQAPEVSTPAIAAPRQQTAAAAVPPSAPIPPRVELAPARPPASAPTLLDDFTLAVYYQRSGDFDSAEQHYKRLLERSDRNPQVHNNLGLLFLERERTADAIRELQAALSLDPGYTSARLNLGVAFMRENRLEAAAAEFRAVLAREPRNVDALVNLALVERPTASTEHAKELLLRALAIAPRHAAAHYNLAVLHDSTGERQRALEHYRAFLGSAGSEHAGRTPEVRARVALLSRQ